MTRKLLAIAVPALLFAGCTTTQTVEQKPPIKVTQVEKQPTQTVIIEENTTTRPVVTTPTPPVRQGYNSFADWKNDFSMRAVAAGYSSSDVQRLMDASYLNQQVVSLDGQQAEFAKMPWSYVDSAVSDAGAHR